MKSSSLKKLFRFIKSIKKKKFSALLLIISILTSYIFGVLSFFILEKTIIQEDVAYEQGVNLSKIQAKVLPQKGYKVKIKWSDLGKKMIEDGVIDEQKLAKAVFGKDEIPQAFKKYLDGSKQKEIIVDQTTAQFWVDLFWGLGLANKNPILESGPMAEGGNTANYASTGGWTLGKQDVMNYYSKFSYVQLSAEQQKIVQEIADNVYRPCCGNPTSFPDCNHGMAALAVIELLVSQGKSKKDIYKDLLTLNSYWFPQTYLDIAYHFEKAGRDYAKTPAEQILSKTFSSAMGYSAIKREIGEIAWPALKGAGSCGA